MQQRCTNCGAPLQPGSVVCTTCGTPVSSGASGSYGAGAYDPTVRAGTPPNTGYGSQPYGTPPSPGFGSQPYGAPPPNYGAPPPPNYGAPPSPGFGSQPYGAPPPPNYGAPPPPVYPVMQPPQRSRRGLFVALGGIGVFVVILIVVCVVLGGVLGKFTQQVTTGTHVTAIHTGTGFDQNTGAVTGEKNSFSTGDTVWIVYTVTNPDAGAHVVLKLYNNGSYESSSDPVQLDSTTNTYANSVQVQQTGTHKVEIDYNGVAEGTITFNVT